MSPYAAPSADPYVVLGVRPGASRAELRSAWRRAAWSGHPDQGGDPNRFVIAAAAYARLLERGTRDHVTVVPRRGARYLVRRWLRHRLVRGPSRVA